MAQGGKASGKEPADRNKEKTCIFDIDNTLTVYKKSPHSTQCPGLINATPNWPSDSGTTESVVNALKACDEGGFTISIATAETGDGAWSEAQHTFLLMLAAKAGLENSKNQYNKDFGKHHWMRSPLFQNSCTALGYTRDNYSESIYCRTEPCEFGVSKIPSYMNILNHLKIDPNRYNESIMFDDGLPNLTDAYKLGLQVCQASPECGGQECKGGCGVPASCIPLIKNQPRLQPRETDTLFTLEQYHPDVSDCK